MAGIELNNITAIPTNRAAEVSSNAPAQESIRRTSEAASTVAAENARETEKEDRQKAMQEAAEAREAALENVVSRSEDGDTVQVSDDGAAELAESTEGSVVAGTAEEETLRTEDDFSIAKKAETEDSVEIAAVQTAPAPTEVGTEDEGPADDQTVNGPPYSGYTDQQLETFYLRGDISRSDYTTEESRREAIREQVQDDNTRVNEDMARVGAVGARTEQVDFAIQTALNSDSEIDIESRLSVVSNRNENQARMTEEAGRLWDYQLRA